MSPYLQAKALKAPGDTLRAFLAKLDAAAIPYRSDAVRILMPHQGGREAGLLTYVLVDDQLAASFTEGD
jgi:hypothetical protein